MCLLFVLSTSPSFSFQVLAYDGLKIIRMRLVKLSLDGIPKSLSTNYILQSKTSPIVFCLTGGRQINKNLALIKYLNTSVVTFRSRIAVVAAND